MPIIEITEKDMLREKVPSPGWYRVKVTGMREKPANEKGNIVWPMDGEILFNADNGDKEFAGVPTPASWNFNSSENAKGFIIGFLKALGGEVKIGARFALENSINKEVDMYIDNKLYQGRIVPVCEHKYRIPREVAV